MANFRIVLGIIVEKWSVKVKERLVMTIEIAATSQNSLAGGSRGMRRQLLELILAQK